MKKWKQRKQREPEDRYIKYLEHRVRELEPIVAKFGCYEDGMAIVCMHCPDVNKCEYRYTEMLGEPIRCYATEREFGEEPFEKG